MEQSAVTKGVASRTAVLVCQGRAIAHGRYAVGLFDDPVAIDLLDRDERDLVERVRGDSGRPVGVGGRMSEEMLRHVAVTMVPRTIAIDEAVRDAGSPQVVLLGAGLDARAWRLAELADAVVFEVDHPASQADKQRRARGVGAPVGRRVPVAVDLARDPLAPALQAAGFDRGRPTTWVWEGVVPYLRPGEVRATVAGVAALSAPTSRLVVNYQARSLPLELLRRVTRVIGNVVLPDNPLADEPWRSLWSPSDMRMVLQDSGFDVVADDDLLTLSAGLGLPLWGRPSLANGRLAVASRV